MLPGSIELVAQSQQQFNDAGTGFANPFGAVGFRFVPTPVCRVHLGALECTPPKFNLGIGDYLLQSLGYGVELFFGVFHVIYPVEFKGDYTTNQRVRW